MSTETKKKVVLIGDSIRLGYQPVVAEQLADIAEVWGPTENGGHSPNLLTFLHLWAVHRQPDLIHVNSGLHDLKTIVYGGRDNLVPVSHYRRNVRAIFRTIRTYTKAGIIWATTTPIDEQKAHAAHAKWRDFDRYEKDVVAYNAAAVQEARRAKVPVNDLHRLVLRHGRAAIQTDDGVHFTAEGYRVLGAAVSAAIRKQLTP